MNQRQLLPITVAILLIVYVAFLSSAIGMAQVRISPTPLSAILPVSTPLPTSAALATPTPTRTPTPLGRPTLQLGTNIESANIRAQPDTSANILGQLDRGTAYVILGRYVRWLQFEYSRSPSGYGWVFDELVEVVGDQNQIPNIENPFSNAVPLLPDNEGADAANATGDEEARLIQIPEASVITNATTESGPAGAGGRLPTFTPPPDASSILMVRTPDILIAGDNEQQLTALVERLTTSGVPPIVPMGLLFGFGILGLLVAQIRK